MGLNKYFSVRQGYKSPKTEIQIDGMDVQLRTALWNAMCQSFWLNIKGNGYIRDNSHLTQMLYDLWTLYFKKAHDDFPEFWTPWEKTLKHYVFNCTWDEVYEIIEFMMDHWGVSYQLKDITNIFNNTLERELSGYRIINCIVTPITNQMEIDEINQAIESNDAIRPVKLQLEEALRKLSKRDEPDYRGSIKDSISSVESLCRLISKEPKLELGKALKSLEQNGKVKIHPSLRNGFMNIYGWTSDDQGIRHGLMDEPNLTFDDAKYMLVSCSAFINYLISKAAQAGLEF